MKKEQLRIVAIFLKLYFFLSYQSNSINGFYTSWVHKVDFLEGEQVVVKSVKLTSSRAQLPFDYYSLPICRPERINYKSESLGEILRGDHISNTTYNVRMKVDALCKLLCNSLENPLLWTNEQSAEVAEKIQKGYKVHLLIDNIPCIVTKKLSSAETFENGYELGFVHEKKIYIYNYLKFILHYHTTDGFLVQPYSVDLQHMTSSIKNCQLNYINYPQEVNPNGETKLLFAYDVKWEESSIRWESRWDVYLNMTDSEFHWFSVINLLIIVIFLSVLIKILRRDIAKYNQVESLEDSLEESGWKIVHGDVFRPPVNQKLFVAVIGSGIQIFFMLFITLSMLGILSPSNHGGLATFGSFLYVFMGLIAGYQSARLYKTFRGMQWRHSALITATLYPGFVLGTFALLNLLFLGAHSSGAIPLRTIIQLLSIWLGISVPLIFLGYYFGYRKQPLQHPVRIHQIPRQIPDQPWYLKLPFNIILSGLLPFGAMFIELFFILSAIWDNHIYYLFGFLFLVFIILLISCCQISVLMNYHWWWQSILTGGSSALFVFAYSIFYFFKKLEIRDFTSVLLYFGYMAIIVSALWLLTGTFGFYAAYLFIRKIYAAVKID